MRTQIVENDVMKDLCDECGKAFNYNKVRFRKRFSMYLCPECNLKLGKMRQKAKNKVPIKL